MTGDVCYEEKKYSTGTRKFLQFGLVLPIVIWLLMFLIVPYVNLLINSFWTNGPFKVEHTFTLDNYIKFFTSGTGSNKPVMVLADTFRISVIVMICTILISFPLAYFINFKVKKNKQLFYMLAIIPLWVSYIMRAYSWRIILGTNGVLNSFLMWTGITKAPIEAFLYSDVSVIIAMVHIYTPFVLMPMYTAMEQIPKNLVEASKDLGCGRIRTFVKVLLPLSLPGVFTGGTYALALSMGDFLAPSLLGGASTSTKISNIAQMQFGTSNNWPYGATIGVIIFALILLIILVMGRLEKHFSKLDLGKE